MHCPEFSLSHWPSTAGPNVPEHKVDCAPEKLTFYFTRLLGNWEDTGNT